MQDAEEKEDVDVAKKNYLKIIWLKMSRFAEDSYCRLKKLANSSKISTKTNTASQISENQN